MAVTTTVNLSRPRASSSSAAPRAGGHPRDARVGAQQLSERLGRLEDVVARHRAEFVDHRDEVEQGSTRLVVGPDIKGRVDQLSRRVVLLEGRAAQATDKSDQLRKEQEALCSEAVAGVERVERGFQDLRAQISELRSACDTGDTSLRALDERVTSMQSRVEERQTYLATHAIPQLHRALAALRVDVTRLRVARPCPEDALDVCSSTVVSPQAEAAWSEVALTVKQLEEERAQAAAESLPCPQTQCAQKLGRRSLLEPVPEDAALPLPGIGSVASRASQEQRQSLEGVDILDCIRSWQSEFVEDVSKHIARAVAAASQGLEDEMRCCEERSHGRLAAELRESCEEQRRMASDGHQCALARVEDEVHAWSESVLAGVEHQQRARDESVAMEMEAQRRQLDRRINDECRAQLAAHKPRSAMADEEVPKGAMAALASARSVARTVAGEVAAGLATNVQALEASHEEFAARMQRLETTLDDQVHTKARARPGGDGSVDALAQKVNLLESYSSEIAAKVNHVDAETRDVICLLEQHLRAVRKGESGDTSRSTQAKVQAASDAALAEMAEEVRALELSSAAVANELYEFGAECQAQFGVLTARVASVRLASQAPVPGASISEDLIALKSTASELEASVSRLDGESLSVRCELASLRTLRADIRAEIRSEIRASELEVGVSRLDGESLSMRSELASLSNLRADIRAELRELHKKEVKFDTAHVKMRTLDVKQSSPRGDELLHCQRELRQELSKAACKLHDVGAEISTKQSEMQRELQTEMTWCAEEVAEHRGLLFRQRAACKADAVQAARAAIAEAAAETADAQRCAWRGDLAMALETARDEARRLQLSAPPPIAQPTGQPLAVDGATVSSRSCIAIPVVAGHSALGTPSQPVPPLLEPLTLSPTSTGVLPNSAPPSARVAAELPQCAWGEASSLRSGAAALRFG